MNLFEKGSISLISKNIAVPDDLSAITTYSPNDEVNPAEADLSDEGVTAIWSCIEKLYRTGMYPAISFCLRRRGKIVLNRAIGHSHGNGPKDKKSTKKVLMTPDTPVCQFSASKAVTAMLIHILAEQNEIGLMDPVTHYIPEFGAKGKQDTTIYHILSHRGGIPAPPVGTDPDLIYDFDAFIEMLCQSKPATPSGRRMAYHAITGSAILGAIISRVTGSDIRDFIRRTIKEPLGMRYFNYGVPEEEISRVATNYSTGWPILYPLSKVVKRALSASWNEVVDISNDPRFMAAIVPAGNLVATADEMSQFFQLMLNQGSWNGKQIFSPLTARRAILETGAFRPDGTLIIPMRYSSGFMLGGSPVGIWGPFSERAYGHIGFLNIFCWADPERDIAVSLQTTGKVLFGPHLWPLARLLINITKYCEKSDPDQHDADEKSTQRIQVQELIQKLFYSFF